VAVSFAPAKQERYLYFAIPFFFGLWGMAAATLVPALYGACRGALAALGDFGRRAPGGPAPVAPGRGPAGRRVLAGTLAFLAVAFVASQNDASRMTIRMVLPGDGEPTYRQADWASVLPELRDLASEADVVLSTYVLKPLYYLDRGDYHLSWTETAEAGFDGGRPVEFARDSRTGLPAISTPESLTAVMGCFASGLILTERFHFDLVHIVPEPTATFIREHTEEVPLPADSWVIAYRWRRPAAPSASTCSLPRRAAGEADRPVVLQVAR
jgi:hypothetical protein